MPEYSCTVIGLPRLQLACHVGAGGFKSFASVLLITAARSFRELSGNSGGEVGKTRVRKGLSVGCGVKGSAYPAGPEYLVVT